MRISLQCIFVRRLPRIDPPTTASCASFAEVLRCDVEWVARGFQLGRRFLFGGFIAGTIDIGSAALINRASPILILHFDAAGLLGRSALEGGASMAILGLVLQWAMSLVIAAAFVFPSRLIPALARSWLRWGLAYGVGSSS
jgi:hypothetical protein